jgi:hypothetical protein
MTSSDVRIALESDEPTPVHRAIDRLSAALLDVQRLRRQSAAHDALSPDLERLETTLQELGVILRQLQENS